MLAGDLHAGEPVRTLDGQTATVAWVHTVPGQADYYNLTVADDHTYAVGDGQYVVHNTDCEVTDLDTIDALRAEYNKPSSGNASFMRYTVEGDGVEPGTGQGFKAAFSRNPNPAGDLAPDVPPEERMLSPQVDKYLRGSDAEYKLAEWFAHSFGDTPNITGNVTIVSEYPIYGSCSTLDKQLHGLFPNLNVELRWAGRPWRS